MIKRKLKNARPLGLICLITFSIFFLIAVFPYFITNHLRETDVSPAPEAEFKLVKNPQKISIYLTDSKRTVTVNFEEYIKGVVACEMPSTFHEEALKAQAVAARTYSTARILNDSSSEHPSAHLCDSTHCQVYKSPSILTKLKGEDWMKKDWKKICEAVESTKEQKLYYKGELVKQALFHSSSGGKTENSEDVFSASVPYLVSVDSPYESEATHQNEIRSFSIKEFNSAIKESFPGSSFGKITSENIKILNRSNGNRVDDIQIGNETLKGTDIRKALDLSSANFSIKFKGDKIIFTSNGSGHGVGMSQYGADGMAKAGYNYKQILTHYYSGTEIY